MNVTTGNTQTVPIIVPSISGISGTNYKDPTSYQYSIGVQQSLGARSVLAVAYVGNQNRHLNDYREINLPPQSALAGLITSGGSGYNQMLPYLGFRSLRLAQNEAEGHYNSIQVNLHANVHRDLELQFGYTLSRAIDPNTGGSGGDLSNLSNSYTGWQYDVGPSPFDRTHIAFVNFVYQLPIFRNASDSFTKGVLGGWEVAGIGTMESGAPFDVTLGGNQGSNGVQNTTNRPDLGGAVHYVKTRSTTPFGMQWIDATGLKAPALGAFGNLPHNYFRGPGRDNWNLALHKTFSFNERSGLELRLESFNTFNHVQFRANATQGGISNNFSGSNFGLITTAYDPLVLQLGAKLYF